jgi:membrane protein DedA with SNARE-associated domain
MVIKGGLLARITYASSEFNRSHRINGNIMTLELFLLHYGYLAVFGAAGLVGETAVIAAGFLAHQGYLRLEWVMAVVMAAGFIADQTSFLVGGWVGIHYLERKPNWQPRIAQVRRLMYRYGYVLILGFRFIIVLHAFIPPVLGALGFDRKRYTKLNALGACLWAVVNAMIGYLFGMAIEPLVDDFRQYELWVVAGFVAAGILAGLIIGLFLRRKPGALLTPAEEQTEEVF